MKHFIFLLFLLLIRLNIWAQPYTSIFGDTLTTWNLGSEIFDSYRIMELKSNADTMVGNHLYKKVVYQNSFEPIGFLREDLSTGKVWFLTAFNQTEHLVMDLDLMLGDSFKINSDLTEVIYVKVDSVYYINNKKHIRFNSNIGLGGKQEKLVFIEGVGSNAGFTFQEKMLSLSHQRNILLCAFKDSTAVFKNTLFNGDCSPLFGSVKAINANTIKWTLFPNPFNQTARFSIDNPGLKKFKLLITDQLGKTYQWYENSDVNYVIINKNDLSEGIYYFNLISDNIVIASGKFIIN
ncbi:MAG: T9SS type A sorting domain-containing protein [Bacteroidia bacterium]|jgi:hypothetical protein|nr:T9SS type A sorting domain-containing protein [Bacteroidia bacterium]